MNTNTEFLEQIDAFLEESGVSIPDHEHARLCVVYGLEIVSRIGARLGLGSEHAKIMAASSLLHESGASLSVRDWHRKTFDLVRSACLPGFTEQERLIAACAARYHGGPYPNIEHAGFGEMSDGDQRVVRRIAAIGRVAVALNASRMGIVDRIDVFPRATYIELIAYVSAEPAIERGSLREAEGSFMALTQEQLITTIQDST